MRARILLAIFCAAVACSGEPERDAGIDTGVTDAGAIDARPDAHDVGADAHDVGADAPLSRDDPGWTRLPGFPDECYLAYARQPQAVLAFHWEPCLGGLPACEWTVVDRQVAPTLRIPHSNGGADGRDAMIWILRESGPPAYDYYVVVHAGLAVAAWRAQTNVPDTSCDPATTANAVAVGLDASYLLSGARHGDLIGHATWADLSPLVDALWTLPGGVVAGGDFLQAPSVGATTFAGDLATGILIVEPPRSATFAPGSYIPVVVGHEVIFNWGDGAGHSAIHIASLDGGDRVLYTPPMGSHCHAVVSDGHDIAWRQGLDSASGPFRLNELWTAAFVTDSARLVPRRVRADLPQCGTTDCATIGDGMLAYAGGRWATAIDLADGTQRRYTLPAVAPDRTGWSFTDNPLWVTRNEVVVPGGHRATPTGPFVHAAIRIDLPGLPVEPAHSPDAAVSADAGTDTGP